MVPVADRRPREERCDGADGPWSERDSLVKSASTGCTAVEGKSFATCDGASRRNSPEMSTGTYWRGSRAERRRDVLVDDPEPSSTTEAPRPNNSANDS